MKHLLATALVFAGILPVAAQDELCAIVGEVAEMVMAERQTGQPLSGVMATLELQPDSFVRMMQAMILDAYARPAAATEKSEVRAVSEFRNAWELSCYQALLSAN